MILGSSVCRVRQGYSISHANSGRMIPFRNSMVARYEKYEEICRPRKDYILMKYDVEIYTMNQCCSGSFG